MALLPLLYPSFCGSTAGSPAARDTSVKPKYDGIFARILCMVSLLALIPAGADATQNPAELKPAAIVYFNSGSAIDADHASMIGSMVKEASSTLGVAVRDYPLPSETGLSEQIEKIADSDVGLIVIVEPHDTEALAKLPSLYPDIRFTVIGASRPLYLTNVRSIAFKESEGVFMMGALAALESKSGTVSFLAKENNNVSRNLAYAFLQGTQHANADVQILEQLGKDNTRRTTGAAPKETNADIVFVLDEELLDNALRNARNKKQLVITCNHALTGAYPGVVLTSLVNHYDLALYHTLHSYRRGIWRSGSETMGIGNSYIDYALDADNRKLIPKETVEQIETVKDFVSQGIIQISALAQ